MTTQPKTTEAENPYLTREDGQGIEDTIKVIEDAGFTYEIESA
jgi:hypothetical protein